MCKIQSHGADNCRFHANCREPGQRNAPTGAAGDTEFGVDSIGVIQSNSDPVADPGPVHSTYLRSDLEHSPVAEVFLHCYG